MAVRHFIWRGLPLRGRVFPALAIAFLVLTRPLTAEEKGSHQISPFYGSFGQAIPIQVPPFHGLEPRLSLNYSSEGRNGWIGVGWRLAGFSTIERVNAGRGTPKFDGNDKYLLDGQELVPCGTGSVSPSCTSGGNFSTTIESYLKIVFNSSNNSWTVFGKDGTRTVLTPIYTVPADGGLPGGTLRWGQTSSVDTLGNTVTYNWTALDNGDVYPSSIAYGNGYGVSFARETRPDSLSFAASTTLGQTSYRLKSIFVYMTNVGYSRAYKLSYSLSP